MDPNVHAVARVIPVLGSKLKIETVERISPKTEIRAAKYMSRFLLLSDIEAMPHLPIAAHPQLSSQDVHMQRVETHGGGELVHGKRRMHRSRGSLIVVILCFFVRAMVCATRGDDSLCSMFSGREDLPNPPQIGVSRNF
jgi:hypothetical protein